MNEKSFFYKIISCFIISFLFHFFSFHSLSHAKIIFKNLPRKLEKSVKREFKFIENDFQTGFQIDQIIRRLMREKIFENVYAFEGKNKNIIIVSKFLKKVKAISIKGNKVFSQKRIQTLLTVFEGDAFRPMRLMESKEALTQFYHREGYYNAKIDVKSKKKKNSVYIHFQIKENKPCLIQSININSGNLSLKKRLALKIKNLEGTIFTQKTTKSIENLSKNLFRNLFFFFSSLQKDRLKYNKNKTNVKLSYSIKNPYRYTLKIKGAIEYSSVKLKRIARFKDTELLDSDFIFEMINRIKNHYLQSGYTHIKVHHVLNENKKKFQRDITLYIEEGTRTRLEKIDVFGELSRPSRFYSNYIKKNSTKLISRGYYSQKDLELGYRRLVSKLKNEGYFNAKIYSTRVEFMKEKKRAYVLVFLSEGSLVRIRSIKIQGNKKLSNQDILRQITIHSKEPLKQNELMKSINNIKKKYKEEGFLEMQILNEESLVKYSERGSNIDIVFKIKEGPKIVVSSLSVEGNKQTEERIILNVLKFKAGDVLTNKNIRASIQRLNDMRLFSKVQIRTLEEGTSISKRTVIVSVSERNPGLLKFALGINNERGLTLRGLINLSYNNLFGTARTLNSRFEGFLNINEIQYPENEINLGYLEPFLFRSLVKGRLNLTRSERAFDYLSEHKTTLMQRSNQVEIMLEHKLTDFISTDWILYRLNSTTDFLYPKKNLPNRSYIDQRTADVGLEIHFNHLDNVFFPTKGFLTRGSIYYASPRFGSTSKIEYIKTELRNTFYIALGHPRWIFAQSLRGGYLENLNKEDKSGVPANQAFILGGPTTLRGFSRHRERIPSHDDLPISSGNQLLITGKSIYYLGKTEFRFPVFKSFGGAFFYDAGEVMVWDRKKGKLKFKRPFRQVLGFGGRIKTPVARLAFDIGCKVRPLSKESRCKPHFSIESL